MTITKQFYIYNEKNLNVIQDKYIGQGTQWKVFRIIFKENNSYNYNSYVYKKNINNNGYAYEKNINIFNNIKKIGIPTLRFYHLGIVNNKRVIFAQDLNNENLNFLSPNSARKKEMY